MGSNVIAALTAIATGLIGLAAFSVLVSKNANTTQVIQAGGNAFAMDLGAAVSPVTGGGGGYGGFSPFTSLNQGVG